MLRPYSPADFDALFQLDQICYPRGIAYSKRTLRQYLAIPGAICIVAENNENAHITGFIVAESAPPEAHIITLDVDPAARRQQIGSATLRRDRNATCRPRRSRDHARNRN